MLGRHVPGIVAVEQCSAWQTCPGRAAAQAQPLCLVLYVEWPLCQACVVTYGLPAESLVAVTAQSIFLAPVR